MRRALVAEDNEQGRFYLTSLLKGHGFEVDSAANGAETTQLKEYSETLVRKLEAKRLQLEEANRSLQQQVLERDELAKLKSRFSMPSPVKLL